MTYVVVRLRGHPERSHRQERTLELLRLNRINHATLVPKNPSYEGMVKKVEHFITYGEADTETIAKLLRTRGRAPGNKPLTDAYVAEHTPYASIDALAEALASGETELNKLEALKPVFRLSPARGGFENHKRHFNAGGSLGYRGGKINDLIERML